MTLLLLLPSEALPEITHQDVHVPVPDYYAAPPRPAKELPYLFSQARAVWHPRGVSRSSGRSLTGSEQVVGSNFGWWTATLEAPVHGEERTLAWQAFLAGLDGAAGEFLVPYVAPWRPRDVNGRMLAHQLTAPLQTGGLFGSEGFAAEDPEIMFVAAAAEIGARRLVIRHPNVRGLKPGHNFGIGERLYRVATTWQISTGEVSGGQLVFNGEPLTFGGETLTLTGFGTDIVGENVSVVEFWPGLREAVAAETPLVLGRPFCRMRLAGDETGVLDQPYGIAGTVTVDFVEAV